MIWDGGRLIITGTLNFSGALSVWCDLTTWTVDWTQYITVGSLFNISWDFTIIITLTSINWL